MGRFSRDKGGRGEREVMALIQPVVDKVCDELEVARIELMRDGRQRYEPKRYDIVGIPWMCLEVKRQENVSGINGWWHQCLDACKPRQVPVLMWRKNRGKWKVRMKVPILLTDGRKVRCTVNITLDVFLVWFREELKIRLG